MIEREVKILEIDEGKLRKKLEEIGAKFVEKKKFTTIFFDFPDGSIRKKGDIFRIRKFKGKIELTYKKRKGVKSVKEVEEFTIESVNFKEAVKILESLGLQEIMRIKKQREIYKINKDTVIVIDKIKGVPPYVEIEGNSREIKKLMKELGLENKKIVKWDTFELLEYYRD